MDVTITRIIEEMKLQNKKHADLATYIGVTPNVITDWKSGRIKSYKKYLHAIADFLGVSVEYLKGETEIKNSPLSNENGLSESQREIIALFDSAPPELQAAALAVLRSAEQRSHTQDTE